MLFNQTRFGRTSRTGRRRPSPRPPRSRPSPNSPIPRGWRTTTGGSPEAGRPGPCRRLDAGGVADAAGGVRRPAPAGEGPPAGAPGGGERPGQARAGRSPTRRSGSLSTPADLTSAEPAAPASRPGPPAAHRATPRLRTGSGASPLLEGVRGRAPRALVSEPRSSVPGLRAGRWSPNEPAVGGPGTLAFGRVTVGPLRPPSGPAESIPNGGRIAAGEFGEAGTVSTAAGMVGAVDAVNVPAANRRRRRDGTPQSGIAMRRSGRPLASAVHEFPRHSSIFGAAVTHSVSSIRPVGSRRRANIARRPSRRSCGQSECGSTPSTGSRRSTASPTPRSLAACRTMPASRTGRRATAGKLLAGGGWRHGPGRSFRAAAFLTAKAIG